MAIIPAGQKILTVASTIDTNERKSTQNNSPSQYYAIEDITDTATVYDNTTSTNSATTMQDAIDAALLVPLVVAASDETTALTAGTAKVTFRMPFAMKLTAVRASLSTAQASGNILTVDINEGGVSILSTKITIDNTEKTSTTAATPAVISDANLADDAEITIDIDQVGDGTATGLKVTLIGYKK